MKKTYDGFAAWGSFFTVANGGVGFVFNGLGVFFVSTFGATVFSDLSLVSALSVCFGGAVTATTGFEGADVVDGTAAGVDGDGFEGAGLSLGFW